MDIQKVLNLKGVSKKIWSIFLEAGVKNQNFKLEPIGLKFCRVLGGPKINFFCFLNHIVLGLYLKVMAIFKKKMWIFQEWSQYEKNVTEQKVHKIRFYTFLGGSKIFLIFSYFSKKNFFGTPFTKRNCFLPVLSLIVHTFWITTLLDPKYAL